MNETKITQSKIMKLSLDSISENQMINKSKNTKKDMFWFFCRQERIRLEYPNKYIVIKNQKVFFVADTPEEMIAKTQESGEDEDDLFFDYRTNYFEK